MASPVLTQLGGAIPGVGLPLAIGGGIAGAYIDSRWINALRGSEREHRLKPYELSDIAPQQANEGSPLPFCLGPRCRTSGVTLWESRTSNSGELAAGKGSSPAQSGTPGVRFFKSVAICYHYDKRVRIEQVERILAEGKTIYAAEGAVSVSSTNLEARRVEWKHVFSDGAPTPSVTEVWLEIVSPAGTPDLEVFQSGLEATLTGFTDAENNGTFHCLGVETDEATGDQVARFRNLSAVTNDESGNPGARGIAQTIPETRGRFYESITFYNGSPDQQPDPDIEEEKGAGTVPAFRGYAYCVIKNMRLAEFGGRLPQMTFVVRESSSRSLASAIAALCERGGMSYPAYNVSRLTGDLTGLVFAGVTQGTATLAPLLLAYDISVREEAGQLTFFHRSDATVHDDIAESEFGAGIDGPPFEYSIEDAARIPREVVVHYLDVANDLQPGKGSAIYNGAGAYDTQEIRLNIALTAQKARQRAHELLWTAVANQYRVTTSLPPNRCYVREGDRIVLRGDEWVVLERTENEDLSIALTMAREWSGTDWSNVLAVGAPENEVVPAAPAAHRLFRIDIAPLRDGENRGEYWTHVCLDPAVRENGARLMRGPSATNLSGVQQIGIEGIAGRVISVLPTANFEYPDFGSTVDVFLLNGTLSSVTMADVSNGTNWAVIGREIVGFTTATLIGTRTYRLSGFLRGRRGTEQWVGSHVIGEEFILLDDTRVKFFGAGTAVGQTIFATAISPNANASTIDPEAPIAYNFRAGTIRPFAPYPVWWVRDPVAQTATLRWTPRSTSIASQIPTPASNSTEFRLELYDSPTSGGGILLITVPTNQLRFSRTATVWGYTFTAAALTAVGEAWNATLTARVCEANGGVLSEYRELTG